MTLLLDIASCTAFLYFVKKREGISGMAEMKSLSLTNDRNYCNLLRLGTYVGTTKLITNYYCTNGSKIKQVYVGEV